MSYWLWENFELKIFISDRIFPNMPSRSVHAWFGDNAGGDPQKIIKNSWYELINKNTQSKIRLNFY